MSEKIKFENKEWEVLKDCGTFVVAKVIGTDEVRNIPKKKEKDGKADQKND